MHRSWVVSASYREVINTVVEARKSANISQRELARRLSKPPSFVNKIEMLERRLDVLEFILISRAIGIEPERLMESVRDRVFGVIAEAAHTD